MKQMPCLFSGTVVAGEPTVVDFLQCVVLRSENLLDSPLISLWSRRGNQAQSGEATCQTPSVLLVVSNVSFFFLLTRSKLPTVRWSTSVHKMSRQFQPSSSSETATAACCVSDRNEATLNARINKNILNELSPLVNCHWENVCLILLTVMNN